MSRTAITAVGMLTSVGYSAASSAAALRAGITRPSPLRRVHFDPEELGRTPIIGHSIAGFTDGFEGAALLGRMAAHALSDLLVGAEAPTPSAQTPTGLYFGVSPYRSTDLPFVTDMIVRDLPGRTLSMLGAPLQTQEVRVFVDGHASVLTAFDEAVRAIDMRRLDRVLVVGVDSLLREADLDWLEARGLLKNTDNPMGLIPGEGAAAILLEAEPRARRRHAQVYAWLESVAVEQDPESRAAGTRGSGRGLALAIHRCLGARREVGDTYHDLNGEDPRAWEWGAALARLARDHSIGSPLHTIADSIGDTGAASGAIALAAAVRAFVRGYARGDASLVCSSSDSGKVGAALLSRGA